MAAAPAVAVALRDGSTVIVRPVRPDDRAALATFLAELDDDSRRLRFFSAGADMGLAAGHMTQDYDWLHGLVVVQGEDARIVGHAEYVRDEDDGGVAEVAFETAAALRGMGLATILLAHLAAHAAARGIHTFVAEVLPENHSMIGVFRDSGFPVEVRTRVGVLRVTFPTELTEKGRRRFEQRDRRAAAAAVAAVLEPASVMVVGASADPRAVGGALLANIVAGGFRGPVHAVNRRGVTVDGATAHRSVGDVPGPVELAVIAVPAEEVLDVARGCAAKGAKALVVASAGFGEAGAVGEARRDELLGLCRRTGMRLVGPNCLGVVNTTEDVRLHATFAPRLPAPGPVGFLTQSGGLGIAVLDRLGDWDVGLSSFVSVGDKADISGNDLLQYWEGDDHTSVVVLYLQSFGNPRRFGRIARRVARRKPIVAVRAGRGAVGEGAGSTTTGALMRDATVRRDALFEQAGVIRVETLSQLFDTALILAYQPLPAGPRMAVVGNSSALGVLVTDALLDEGLRLAGPPVDVGAAAPPSEFAAAVAKAVGDEDADGLVAVFVPPVATPGAEYARALREAVAGVEKPIVAVFLAAEGVPAELAVPREDGGGPGHGSVPSYSSPERAVAALARVFRYARWRSRPVGEFAVPLGVDTQRARELIAGWGPAERHLGDAEMLDLLSCYGITVSDFQRVGSAAAAAEAAAELGLPVALKAVGDRWRHRTDLVGVRLDLDSPAAVQRAYADIAQLTGQHEVYVQRMAPKGVSCVLEIVDDPSFGSLLSFGLSGMATELLGDRAFAVVPVSDQDAAALVRAPRAAPLLAGYRGTEPARLDALEDLVLRVGKIAEDLPEVRSLVLDPVLASPEGVFVAGVLVVVGTPPQRDDSGPRRLR